MIKKATTTQMRRTHVMNAAIRDGIYTDHMSDGHCEQLLREGWLERAETIARRPHVNRTHTYLPTEKANTEWQESTQA